MRECFGCGSTKTYVDKRKTTHWYRNGIENQWLCANCNRRYVRNPNREREYNRHWLERNREKSRIYNRKNYYSHKEKRLQFCKERYALDPEYYRKWSWRKVVFLGKQIYVGFRQQTGYCSRCSNNVHNGSCKLTHMHHLLYVPIMIWACRIELCASCHKKTH